jgi:type I restriction enzyme S subunit
VKRYDRYKDSGIEWIGEIPEHWEVKRLKYVVEMNSGNGITSEMIKEEGDFPVFGGNGIRGYYSHYTHEGSFILIGRQGALCGNINYSNGKFWASEHAIVCTPKIEYNVKWFGELLRTMNLNQYSVSAAQPGLSVENLKVLQIPIPPLPEQHAIAAYLDRKTAEIDALIVDKKRLLELYEEEKTALINQAVTKGITPGVPMKDSGVEWLGEVPEGWEVVRFNQFIDLRHGYQFRNFDFTTSGIKIIKISQLLPNGKLEVDDVSYISEDRLKDFTDILINEGDILMALTGGTIGKIIRAPEINEPLLQNYRVGNFFPKNESITKDFLFWILSSRLILEQILFDQRETGQPNIGKEDFSRMVIVLPPNTSEQHRIVRHIESENARIDAKKAKTEKLIELLVEYRAALISEVVTGGGRIVGL